MLFSSGATPNEVGLLHNAVLDNDWSVRQDNQITVEDTYDFLSTASEYYCAGGACDATTLTNDLMAATAPLLQNGELNAENVIAVLDQGVDAGLMSRALADELADILQSPTDNAESTRQVQERIDNLLFQQNWDSQDTKHILLLRGISHSSYDYWDARSSGGKVNWDAVGTLVTLLGGLIFGQPEVVAAAPLVGALCSGIADGGDTKPAAGAVFETGTGGRPVTFSEDLLFDGAILSLEGNLGGDGGVVTLYGEGGELLAERVFQAGESLLPLTTSSNENRIVVKGWSPYGTIVLAVSEEGGNYSIE
jgi:hypothetical protein